MCAAPPGSIRMVLDESVGIFVPEIADPSKVTGKGKEFRVCPGKGLPIREMARNLYDCAAHDTFELGRYRLAVAAHSTSPKTLKNASSGGVMTEISLYLLQTNRVDGITALRFVYGPPGPRVESFIARSPEDLFSAQGSKYCPTTTNGLVRECVETGGRYLFLGTPCQIGALRLAIGEDPFLGEVFPQTMTNFCGGYRDFRYLDDLLFSYGLEPGEVEYFRFRGNGQPGSMLAFTRDGKMAIDTYPDYVHRSTIPRQKRCWYCVDATGELADLACGDAWIPRFLQDENPWSIVLARSAFAEQIVREMASKGLIRVKSLSFEEIRDSQRSNIQSKKLRQYARIQVSRLLGISVPQWDVELPRSRNPASYLKEIRVLLGKTPAGRWVRKIMRRRKRDVRPQ